MSLAQLPTLPMEVWYMILQHTNDHWTLRGTYLTCKLFAEFYEIDKNEGYRILVSYKNIWLSIIASNPIADWNWSSLSRSRKIPVDFVVQNSNFPWVWGYIDLNYVPWEQVMNLAHHNLNWYHLTNHQDIDWSFVIENLDKSWSLYAISDRMPIHLLIHLPEKFYSWEIISKRSGLPWEFIVDNLHELNLFNVKNCVGKVPWKIIEENKNEGWNWGYLSSIPTFPFHLIEGHEYYCDWATLSRRKDITFIELFEGMVRGNQYSYRDCEIMFSREDVDWKIVEPYARRISPVSLVIIPGLPEQIMCKFPGIDWEKAREQELAH